MDDFANDEEATILENFARGVGEIDRALDAVTKTKLLGQSQHQVAGRDDSAVPADLVDDVAAIMRLDLFLNAGHYLRSTEVEFVARSRAAGDEVRAHPPMSPSAGDPQLVSRSILGMWERPDGDCDTLGGSGLKGPPALFHQQRTFRLLKAGGGNHKTRIGIGRFRVVHAPDRRPDGRILRHRVGDVHWR